MKSGFVSVVGRPSSGKSTLVNRVCGHKVSIVSTAPQTTRNAIRGIFTRDENQLVFVDTPGFHVSERRFNQHIVKLISDSFEDVDLVIYLVDPTRSPGDEDEALRQLVTPLRKRTFIALNKIDVASNGKWDFRKEHRKLALELVPPERIIEISALNGNGVDTFIETLIDAAPEGEHFYPPEFYTDQDPEFRAAEIIREKAIQKMRKELPHSIFVEISDIELSEADDVLWIRAFLLVERESQKGIVVGKKGVNIKTIRRESKKELEELFPQRIDLDLRVKVSKDWRKNEHVLRGLIH